MCSGRSSAAVGAVRVSFADLPVLVVDDVNGSPASRFDRTSNDGGFFAPKSASEPVPFAVDPVSPATLSVPGVHESFCHRLPFPLARQMSFAELREPSTACRRSPLPSVFLGDVASPKLAARQIPAPAIPETKWQGRARWRDFHWPFLKAKARPHVDARSLAPARPSTVRYDERGLLAIRTAEQDPGFGKREGEPEKGGVPLLPARIRDPC